MCWVKDTTGHAQPKSSNPRCYLPLMTNSIQKDITRLFVEILMIKKSCIWIGREAQLATSKQKW